MKNLKVSFQNKDGVELKGVLEIPTSSLPSDFAIFAHCFTCNKNFHAPVEISRTLASAGIGVLRFDFTGLGDSEGDFEDTNFSSNIDDLVAAANFLKEEYKAPGLIIGHSLGGAASLFAAREIESIKAIALINSPSSLSHIKQHFSSSLEEIKNQGYASVKIGMKEFNIQQQFVEDLERNEEEGIFKEMDKALLILHAPGDNIVSLKHAQKIYKAAKHPKSFISLSGADHLLSQKKHSRYAGSMISSWASAYLEPTEVKELETDHEVIANLGSEGYTTQMRAGNHNFLADEPESLGGRDLGPTPYELVSSALAACTSMTLHMYARRKKWKLENVETHVSHTKKHGADCENCEKENTRIDHFEREILMRGELDEKQLDRLLQIADKCPVHKTLSSTSKIHTSLKTD